MEINTINLADKFALFKDKWSPKIIAKMNDYHFKIAKIEGEFVWHSHPETDESFFVVDGRMSIELRDSSISLASGEMCVVPRGVEHKPVAEKECHILMVEPAGTVNTGDAGGDRTQASETWI